MTRLGGYAPLRCMFQRELKVFCRILQGIAWGYIGRPGGDRLSHALRHSIMGAGVFHGRVRDGIGWFIPRHCHQVIQYTLQGCIGM